MPAIKTVVTVIDGHKRGVVGWIFGTLETRTGTVVVHFPGRSHPNECKQYHYSRLREANALEKLLMERDGPCVL